MAGIFRTAKTTEWTRERIDALATPEVRQLRANAERLNEGEVMKLCDGVLDERPKTRGPGAGARKSPGRSLVSRSKAFELRGVFLQNPAWSRSGVRRSDGVVVLTIWAEHVRSESGACSYLLYAPNLDGSRPWSDKSGGKERLEHCRIAAEQGSAEGLLVHGRRLEGSLPDDKALSVDGVDPQIVLAIRVEQRGDEYWAIWGRKSESTTEVNA
jgi:hypothetical protein